MAFVLLVSGAVHVLMCICTRDDPPCVASCFLSCIAVVDSRRCESSVVIVLYGTCTVCRAPSDSRQACLNSRASSHPTTAVTPLQPVLSQPQRWNSERRANGCDGGNACTNEDGIWNSAMRFRSLPLLQFWSVPRFCFLFYHRAIAAIVFLVPFFP